MMYEIHRKEIQKEMSKSSDFKIKKKKEIILKSIQQAKIVTRKEVRQTIKKRNNNKRRRGLDRRRIRMLIVQNCDCCQDSFKYHFMCKI